MPANSRTLFWLNATFVNEPFGVASSWTTTKGSSTPAATPPTSIDDAEIDTAAIVSGSGSAGVFNINAGVTVSGSLNTDVTNATTIGNSSLGMVTVGAGSSWTLSHQLMVGGAGDGHVIVSGGGSLTTDADVSGSSSIFDGIGFGAGTGSVLVTGVGSKWTSSAGFNVDVGPSGVLTVSNGGKVQQTALSGGFFLDHGSMSVDGSSIAEAGTVGGAQTGFLTVDPNNFFAGVGTFTGNIIDNGNIAASDGGAFDGNGALTINGSVSGSGSLTIGAQETLALNGSVSLTGSNGSIDFYGWYGTLAIGNAAGFSSTTPIYNFMPGDTIDLKNVPFASSASSYSFTYGSNGGPNDLRITEGGQTYHLNVGSYYDLSGLLTLKPDAGGSGTAIVYTSGGSSPFQQWGTPLSNFFSAPSGPVDGSVWGLSNSDDGGQPVWIDTETKASSYVAGQAADYNIVLTTQDWIGTQQPLLTVTTTHLIDPFSSRASDVGNLAGSVYVSNNGATGTMDLIYWQASSTPGDYAVEFQPLTTTYVSAPSAGPSTVLTGAPVQLDAAVSQPLSWEVVDNFTSDSPATEGVLGYATRAADPTKEDIHLQGFSTSGVASAPTLAATIANGTYWAVNYSSTLGAFIYDYYSAAGASGAGVYFQTFNPTTGQLGSPTALLLTPGFTTVSSLTSTTLSDGNHLRFVKGFKGSQQVIQDFLGSSTTPITTFNLSSATPDHYAIAAVTDPNNGATDYTVLAYSDNNQVHLELLNNYGQQIGSDYIVPGITSFDRIHTLFNVASNAYRVELDYTVPDPKGGTEIEGLIYDTRPTGNYVTLSGAGGEYEGTPFSDTFIDAAGNYTINGAGGQDYFQINQASNEVLFSLSSSQQLKVSTYSSTNLNPASLTGTTTLIGFSHVNLNDNTVVESNLASGGVRLDVQFASNFAGTLAGLAPGDLIAFDTVGYAPGEHGVFTSNGSGGGTVAIDNSGGTPVASFKVKGNYLSSQFVVSQGAGGIAVVNVVPPPPTGPNDVLLQNVSGQAAIWHVSGATVSTGALLGANPGPTWKEVGTGDFNKDGNPDILLQNMNGAVAVWETNGTSVTSSAVVANPGPSWKAVGTGDFNDDGHSDILLQNANGAVAIWNMTGTSLSSSAVLANPGANWTAVGTGDFNDDGHADILLQNTNGAVAIWETDGTKVTTSAVVANPAASWKAIGTGDFNADGHSDILLQNADGRVAIWEMTGTTMSPDSGIVSSNPGAAWHAIGTNHGGADILLQNTSGQTAIWDMSDTTVTGGGALSVSAGPSWRAVGLT